MNLMSLSVIVASLILPITKAENIKTDFTGKLLRMGYSQEEINAFSKEKSEKFSHFIVEKKEYSNFSYSIENFLENTQSSFQKGALQTVFVHQNNAGKIDWGQLSFSLSKPYVNYTLKLLSNNPGFEQGLSNYLTIGVN